MKEHYTKQDEFYILFWGASLMMIEATVGSVLDRMGD